MPATVEPIEQPDRQTDRQTDRRSDGQNVIFTYNVDKLSGLRHGPLSNVRLDSHVHVGRRGPLRKGGGGSGIGATKPFASYGNYVRGMYVPATLFMKMYIYTFAIPRNETTYSPLHTLLPYFGCPCGGTDHGVGTKCVFTL